MGVPPAYIYLRTLITVFHGENVLLMHRRQSPDAGYWNFLGGKVDVGEDPLEGAQRELREESGMDTNLAFRGVATAIARSTGEHWTLFLFSAHVSDPRIMASLEGPLRWVPPDEVATLPVWPDIPILLPYLRDPARVILAKFTYTTPDPDTLEVLLNRVATFPR